MGRPRTPLTLTAEEQATLRAWAHAGATAPRLAQRATAILLAADGLPWKEICRRTGLSLENSLKWQRRFRGQRLEGLRDRPRPGPPRRISPQRKTLLIALACSLPPDGGRRWSVRTLAKACQVSTASVQRILSVGQRTQRTPQSNIKDRGSGITVERQMKPETTPRA
ncbi:MAG: helix-turn-helix domain-containing protein [Candidatus Tectomicrobia bacterium]|nr:helix-turn-helix domain-containing protein [Candidatus Tectomicrobia bacterium]